MIAADKADYYAAVPFPHCVVDDFCEDEELRAVLAEWPAWERMKFKDCGTSIKAQTPCWEDFGPATTRLLQRLNSKAFIAELERLTGLDGLLADHDLSGGGLHEIPEGGFLDMHVDFNWNKHLRAARKINLLLYLNDGWKWNGDLILADQGGTRPRKAIAPSFNRCVIFNTTEESWHGHPEPLRAPRSRKSIAMYYYRQEPPPATIRSTIYVQPQEAVA